MFLNIYNSQCKNLLLQQLFIGSAHVEQCSKFVLESTNRTISQFYGWLFFAYTQLLVPCKRFARNFPPYLFMIHQ